MKKIFTITLLAAFALIGCNSNNDPQDPQPEPCNKHDVDLIFNDVAGLYYGNWEGTDTYNYYMVLTSHENAYDMVSGSIAFKANSHYLILDLFSLIPSSNLNLSFKMPNGIYTFDAENSSAANTCGEKYTYLEVTDSEGTPTEICFTNGSIEVTDSLIEAMLLSDDGKIYHMQSPNRVVDNIKDYGSIDVDFDLSTLTGDLAVSFKEPAIYAENWGDYLCTGNDSWDLYIDDNADNQEFMLSLLVEPGQKLPIGTYPISGDLSSRIALYGFANGNTQPVGCWYLEFDQEWRLIVNRAALRSGSVTITDNNDDTYTVSVNAKDNLGNTITGSCTAAPQIVDESSLSTFSTGAYMAKHTKKQPVPRKAQATMFAK